MKTDRKEIEQKIKEYSQFVETVLRPDLRTRVKAEKETEQEINDYEELQTRLKELLKSPGSQTIEPDMVDLGHQKVFCRAVVEDTQRIFVHCGLGLHVELTLSEALLFVEKRIGYLHNQVLSHRIAKSKQVREHIHSSEVILDQLANELR